MSDRIRIQKRKQIADSYSYPQLMTETSGLRVSTAQGLVNHEISRISLRPQARLTISQPGDFYELEADRVAQEVIGMSDQVNNYPVKREVIGGLQRKCAACEEEEDEELMSKDDSGTPPSLSKLLSIQRQTAPASANVNVVPSEPNRELTWDDFKGRPKPSGKHAAYTSYVFVRKRIQGTIQFQAKFLFNQSWVLPRYKNPSNRSVNGCSKAVRACEKFLKQNPNGTYSFNGQPDPECQDAIVPSAVQVSSKGDCDSVLGGACDAAMKRDSEERLLNHERTHFHIATALAAKANERIKGGADPNDVEKELIKESKKLQEKYDSETKHGCIASYQAAWDAGIY